ncbi:MAG: hypothetical protein QM723_11825 [Myxococcaceae bacterium]
MTKLETVQWRELEPSPLGEADESPGLSRVRDGLPAPKSLSLAFDGTILALAVGLALWFVCAALVISTFVHPAAARVPAVNPHGGHSFLMVAGQ